MTDDTQRQALARDIARRLQLASLDEVRVIDAILIRLELGRERYGLLDVSRVRDWRKERREELLDVIVYDVARELADEDRERAALREAARVEMLGPVDTEQLELARWQRADERTVVSGETARIALDDMRDVEPYERFDVSDLGGEG